MSLWWVQKDQLDKDQLALIEGLPLRQDALVLGSPGSGKTNVLLRRAQFVRGQNMPNVLVLSFTRPLTEFLKTGCFDAEGREIFPPKCVTTIESWLRTLYAMHKKPLPQDSTGLVNWKRQLATGALELAALKKLPQYDALFVDEAQDLLKEEVDLLRKWSAVLFFVGDDRQKIFEETEGLEAVRTIIPKSQERTLPFHYRVAREICRVADRVLLPGSGNSLESTCHYRGPKPATVRVQSGKQSKEAQLASAAELLQQQVRVYADLIKQGDRLGVIVARREDRDLAREYFSRDPFLMDKTQIVRARESSEDDYNPAFDPSTPICILTVQGCKGLEFRAVHWLFADELSYHHGPEHYYTVITRAKTSLDIYYSHSLPQVLARAHSEAGVAPW